MFIILTEEIDQNIITYTHEDCRTVDIVTSNDENIQIIRVDSLSEGSSAVEFEKDYFGDTKHLIWFDDTTLIIVSSLRTAQCFSMLTSPNQIVFETWRIPFDGSESSAVLLNQSKPFHTQKSYLIELESVDFEGPALKARFSDNSIQLWKLDANHSAMTLIKNPEPFACCTIL